MEKKILIIDDSEQDRKIIRRFLNEAGYLCGTIGKHVVRPIIDGCPGRRG